MKQKSFYNAFGILYDSVKETLSIYQKEEFYRLVFKDIYALADDEMCDNDTIRKITSGNSPIHIKVMKKLRTYEGFELFRTGIEYKVLPWINNRAVVISEIKALFDEVDVIPEDVKYKITESNSKQTNYHVSRTIAATLICLSHSDYLREKDKNGFFRIDFMRLSSDKPLMRYPKYISDSHDAAVQKLIGRADDLSILCTSIINNREKMLVSAVGGIGKTELVKAFISSIMNSEVESIGIESVAWIPYNNHDIRLSIKEALHLKCDLDDVWMEMQSLASELGDRLLIVVDNIEVTDNDEYLKKLSSLPCRILVTSRQRELYGFSNIHYLQPLNMDDCRKLFYRHYEFDERDNEAVNDIVALTSRLYQ